jgi:hypothetical protein
VGRLVREYLKLNCALKRAFAELVTGMLTRHWALTTCSAGLDRVTERHAVYEELNNVLENLKTEAKHVHGSTWAVSGPYMDAKLRIWRQVGRGWLRR